MKTILGFDSWTAGAHKFERLVPALRSSGYRLILVHVGSWGHDRGRPAEETLGQLTVRDIGFYGERGIKGMLEAENPAGVLFLSTRAFPHMSLNRYASAMGIPTCHLYHGVVSVQSVNATQPAYKVNWAQHASMVVARAGKNVRLLVPAYVKALRDTRAPTANWIKLGRILFQRGMARPWVEREVDTGTTIGCVYTDSDRDHMTRNYGVPAERVFVVGNPDLLRFGLGSEDVGSALQSSESRKPQALYIDTALSKSGLVFPSDEAFVAYLDHTRAALAQDGISFVVKLHPAHFVEGSRVVDDLGKLGIQVCSNAEFVASLKASRFVIAEPSTAAMIPAILGLPLFLAQYGPLEGQQYGPVLTAYPLARELKRLDQVKGLLSELDRVLDRERFDRWLQANIGPLPAEDMPVRVARAINKMVEASREVHLQIRATI